MHLPLPATLNPLGQGKKPPSSLLTGLVSYWKLDEASGTRSDSVNSNHLTSNNNVGQATGKIGNAASFVSASQQNLTKASFQNFHASAWTWTAWFYGNTWNTQNDLIQTDDRIFIVMEHSSRFKLFSQNVNSAFDIVVADNFGAPSTGTWYFVCVRHDLTNSVIKISVNLTENTFVYTTARKANGGTFILGGNSAAPGWCDARIDEVGFWTRHLSDAEVSLAYNAGAGLTYPF